MGTEGWARAHLRVMVLSELLVIKTPKLHPLLLASVPLFAIRPALLATTLPIALLLVALSDEIRVTPPEALLDILLRNLLLVSRKPRRLLVLLATSRLGSRAVLTAGARATRARALLLGGCSLSSPLRILLVGAREDLPSISRRSPWNAGGRHREGRVCE